MSKSMWVNTFDVARVLKDKLAPAEANKILDEIMEAPTIEQDDDFGSVVVAAIRYALGRQTYMPSIVIRFALQFVRGMSTKDLFVISDDLSKYDFDADELSGEDWRYLYQAVCDELDCNRGNG